MTDIDSYKPPENIEERDIKRQKVDDSNNDINYHEFTIPQAISKTPFYVEMKQLQIQKECKLGSGGYGTVYRGLYYNTPVAIKELNEKQINPDAKRYFKREAEILAQLKHPNIIPCYGYSLDNDTPFILMQLMDQK